MLRRLPVFRPLSWLVVAVGVAGGAIGAAYVAALRGLNEWLQTFMTTVTTAMPDADPPTPPPFMELADPDRFRSEVEAAGWSDVEIVGVTHKAAWADADAAWIATGRSR